MAEPPLTEDRSALGSAVRTIRRLRRLSVDELAARCKLSSRYIIDIEAGGRDIGWDVQGKLAHGLSIDSAYLSPGNCATGIGHVVGDLFRRADDATQQAIIALLIEKSDSPRKQVAVALLTAESTPDVDLALGMLRLLKQEPSSPRRDEPAKTGRASERSGRRKKH